jgi:hypothetical protein
MLGNDQRRANEPYPFLPQPKAQFFRHPLHGEYCASPKKEGGDTVSDFRPISLIHAVAKIIAKLMALRLQPS